MEPLRMGKLWSVSFYSINPSTNHLNILFSGRSSDAEKAEVFVKGLGKEREKKSLLLFSATSCKVTLHSYSAPEASLISNKIIILGEKSGAPWAIFWCWLKNENTFF